MVPRPGAAARLPRAIIGAATAVAVAARGVERKVRPPPSRSPIVVAVATAILAPRAVASAITPDTAPPTLVLQVRPTRVPTIKALRASTQGASPLISGRRAPVNPSVLDNPTREATRSACGSPRRARARPPGPMGGPERPSLHRTRPSTQPRH